MDQWKKILTQWSMGVQKADALLMTLGLGALSIMMGLMEMFDQFEMNANSSQALINGLRTMIVSFLALAMITLAILFICRWLRSLPS